MSDLVSTIIPVYNRAVFLEEAVQSVLNQTYRPIEIILIDDGSTDGTSGKVRELARDYPDTIKVIHQDNGGPGSAREAGRKAARGEYIQYLDSDDLLLPRKFELQVSALENNPESDIAYGITRLISEDGEVLKEPYKWTGQNLSTLFPALLVDRWWNTHTPLFRRSFCDKIGPWPRMRMAEDWLYDAKAGRLGAKLVHVAEVVSVTRQHSGERLTSGGMSSSKVCDFSKLIAGLYECTQHLNLPETLPEMKHFSRWAFLVARQAGAKGLTRQARECFEISCKVAVNPDLKMKAAGICSKILGWKVCGLLFSSMHLIKARGGPDTMKTSWSDSQ